MGPNIEFPEFFFIFVGKIENEKSSGAKFEFLPVFFTMFTKHNLIDDAIATFKPYSGIAA